MGAVEVTTFLNHLANARHVAAATQNQTLAALLSLYREVLEIELPWLDNLVRAKTAKCLPTVLTRNEVPTILSQLTGKQSQGELTTASIRAMPSPSPWNVWGSDELR